MEGISEELAEVLDKFDNVVDKITPEEAASEIDETTLQVFWRDWPGLSSWAGALWRRLNQDLAEPATPVEGRDDEGGGEG